MKSVVGAADDSVALADADELVASEAAGDWVVVSGQLPSKDGSHSLYAAVIVKQVDARTRSKTSVNDLLRGLAD